MKFYEIQSGEIGKVLVLVEWVRQRFGPVSRDRSFSEVRAGEGARRWR